MPFLLIIFNKYIIIQEYGNCGVKIRGKIYKICSIPTNEDELKNTQQNKEKVFIVPSLLFLEIKTTFTKRECKGICLKLKNDKLDYKDKLDILIKLSNLKSNSGKPYIKRRQRKFISKGVCFVCGNNRAYCKHHIFQLQHGGYDKTWNMIDICFYCHKKIHEWL